MGEAYLGLTTAHHLVQVAHQVILQPGQVLEIWTQLFMRRRRVESLVFAHATEIQIRVLARKLIAGHGAVAAERRAAATRHHGGGGGAVRVCPANTTGTNTVCFLVADFFAIFTQPRLEILVGGLGLVLSNLTSLLYRLDCVLHGRIGLALHCLDKGTALLAHILRDCRVL